MPLVWVRGDLDIRLVEPVQTRLISLEAAVTLLRLSLAIYPPGSWVVPDNRTIEESTEAWGLRKNISEWSWRAIASLKDNRAFSISSHILSSTTKHS